MKESLEDSLTKIALAILDANGVLYAIPEDRKEDETLSYIGFHPKLRMNDCQRLATVRIANDEGILLNYCLYFVKEVYMQVAWFVQEK